VVLEGTLPAEHHIIFHAKNLLGEKIAWAVPCVSTSARRIPGNVFGYLVATVEDGSRLWFVGKRGWSKFAEELDLTTYKVAHEPKFLSENVVLYSLERKPKYVFVFDRTKNALVKKVVAATQQRLADAARFAAQETPAIATTTIPSV
jgi:hypothetical protein